MQDVLAWLEASAFATGLRDLGIWTYGILNLLHILGIGTLLGSVALLDLRLMGAWRSIPTQTLARPTVPAAATGCVLAMGSGVSMLSMNATEYVGNPFFYTKLPALALALLNIVLIQRLAAWRRAMTGESAHARDAWVLRMAGATSLSLWLLVITCGRMIGYW